MKLTEQELRWLSRWEKRERQWPIYRWVVVANGVLCVAAGVYLIHIFHRMQADGVSSFGAAMIIPFALFGLAGLWFVLAFARWRGDIKLRLLLRLIREHQNPDA
jgi:hypothetical protein